MIDISKVYALAKSLPYSDFKTEVSRLIDNIPSSVESDNKYVLVNKKCLK